MKSQHALAVFFLSASLSAGNSTHAVPEQFLGEWGTSLTDCGTEADDTALHIGERHISYHESSGPLHAVVVRGAKEVALVAELASEGETWLDASTFLLSPDGNQLTQNSGANGEPFVRVRCSSILGTRPSSSSEPMQLRGTA
ncbi:hypothetical protein H0E84_10520 [Luteimonas sp. SJ-92]|uniref:Uncharacterized protein n=1 Tax=Luteimonas salinisoli TaxID=2752307 RepID=A0A853JE83_9GAMM|nr:hypothetical protein [Luteimonas salinisoli]NZA26818.1 hypothetical protein [Luteimonas salinisoli]